ncbi:uncharacterized protein LOC110023502 [Phalaenopsis equestris]|uniref:uncharacterized protein LOC110023502 n=1 Tax=Phalaenopsis equestris TaxID=78828 RepID=UPI0009E19490|nr:uncharacterized protein LOC110023502 [Phalaenopsis equestris]
MEAEPKADEWELLSPNTSFLRFGLEDIKDLYSKEIDYVDYFMEQPYLIIDSEDDQASIHHDESLPEVKVEDLEQTELKDDSRVEKQEEDLADKLLRSKPPPRPAFVAVIAEMVPITVAMAAAMVCGFLLGSGRRRADTMRFHTYKDNKEMKEMVRQANRINQVLVGTARGMPPPVMQPATISFGGCFGDML